eukprot:TRINITY_DN3366_c0_g3_i1.p1 TRINITY_DN3366_c0_g3~~TRINITY_DN3366_c0_g3_i1.p1  ORF type:complete len:902 (+),score=290.74 TRINITY_DN3366_c0_g3_i1:88-2706(+)
MPAPSARQRRRAHLLDWMAAQGEGRLFSEGELLSHLASVTATAQIARREIQALNAEGDILSTAGGFRLRKRAGGAAAAPEAKRLAAPAASGGVQAAGAPAAAAGSPRGAAAAAVWAGPLPELPPALAAALKPHQVEGLQFLWEAVAQGGAGAVLAHAMGLGKTLQCTAFLRAARACGACRTALVLAPKSTLPNWAAELGRWGALCDGQWPALPVTTTEGGAGRQAAEAVRRWGRKGGVLLMNYESFAALTGAYAAPGHSAAGSAAEGQPTPGRGVAEAAAVLLAADVAVLDEGHIMRNPASALARALCRLSTPRRVVLTGTPLQNNLGEYWTMVEFVRPGLLPPAPQFAAYFARPIRAGQRRDCSPEQAALMRERAHVLQEELRCVVHRRDQSLLKDSLPPKREHCLLLPLSPLQRALYRRLREAYLADPGRFHPGQDGASLLYFLALTSKIAAHPSLLAGFARQAPQGAAGEGVWGWVEPLLSEAGCSGEARAADSPKVAALLSILSAAFRGGEKVLVFSQYVQTLDMLEPFVAALGGAAHRAGLPRPARLRLDGSATGPERESAIQGFQTHRGSAVMLLSTKAGGLGINLTAAHKVVLFDVCCNPASDRQAVCRAYRYGLEHPLSVYILVAESTPEVLVCAEGVAKEWLSRKVVDESCPVRDHVAAQGLAGAFAELDEAAVLAAVSPLAPTEEQTQSAVTADEALQAVEASLQDCGADQGMGVLPYDSLLTEGDDRGANERLQAAHARYRRMRAAGGWVTEAEAGAGDLFAQPREEPQPEQQPQRARPEAPPGAGFVSAARLPQQPSEAAVGFLSAAQLPPRPDPQTQEQSRPRRGPLQEPGAAARDIAAGAADARLWQRLAAAFPAACP